MPLKTDRSLPAIAESFHTSPATKATLTGYASAALQAGFIGTAGLIAFAVYFCFRRARYS